MKGFAALPILGVIVLLIASGIIYYGANHPKELPSGNSLSLLIHSPQPTSTPLSTPIEVPKTLPTNSQVASPTTSSGAVTNTDGARIQSLEDKITQLSSRVSALENTLNSPAPAVKISRNTTYIPLGDGGFSGDQNWYSLANYLVAIDPVEYPGYSNMQLEVNFRLTQRIGTGRARLFNTTDNSAIAGEVDTTSDSLATYTSYYFTLPSGKKTYQLQVKSDNNINMEISSARIKVLF